MPDRRFATPTRRLLAAAASLAVLAALIVLAFAGVQPPAPLAATAPPDAFSAYRAYAHDQKIAQEVHVTGSPAADRVRAYIVATLTGYGLHPEIQDTTGRNASRFDNGEMAHVRNVVAVLPGTASTGRVLLMAHYDSVQVSFGANDDGAGITSLLEVARAVTAGPKPRNDTVFVFTDAEEACLCGAEAFVALHPLASDPAVVLNLESRGTSGPAVMFQTSPGNAGIMAVYARVVGHPVATSVAVEIYRRLHNDTDLTPVLAAGRFTGLNTAYIDGSAAYHSPLDRLSNVDLASTQHLGANTLALTREFGRVDLGPLTRPSSGDATYFPLPGGLLASYPGWLVWPLAILALVAVVALAWLARRRGIASWPRAVAGFFLALVPLLGAAVLAQLFWALLVALRPGYADLADPHRPLWFRLAGLGLTLTLLLAWYGLSRRRVGAAPLAIGALALLSVLGLAFAALIPGGSYLAALPALAGAIAGLLALSVRPAAARVALLTAGAGVAVLVLAPAVTLFMPALGLATGAAPALFAMMLGLALLPVLEALWRPAPATAPRADAAPAPDNRPGLPDQPKSKDTARSTSTNGAGSTDGAGRAVPVRRSRLAGALPAGTALVLTVALAGVGLGVDRWDARHPLPTSLMYTLDADTATARWISFETTPSSWTRQYVRDRGPLGTAFPGLPDGTAWIGPANAAALPAPEVTVLSDSTAGDERVLVLSLHSMREVRFIAFYGDPGDHRVIRATVDGRDAPAYVSGLDRFGVQFHAPRAEGVQVRLVLRGGGPLRLRVIDASTGFAALPGFQPRPEDVGVAGSHSAELLAVAKTYTF